MKYTLVFVLSGILGFSLSAQEQKAEPQRIQVELGYVVLTNNLNGDDYYNFKYGGAPNSANTTMGGVNLKFTLSTRYKYLDLIAGTIFMVGRDDIGSKSWAPGNTSASDYLLNGGGVYAGISPKLKGKYIGLTSELAIGVFSFKEYTAIFNNIYPPFIDVYEKKASYGLGAMSSLGIYIKLGKVGINPSINSLFSGGANTSFLFYGFVLPITYQF